MFSRIPVRSLCVLLGATSLSPLAIAQVQIDRNFISLGPAPDFGPLNTVGSGDTCAEPYCTKGGTSGTVTGAVQAILADKKLGRDTWFVGATNGGIWRTENGGKNWRALTENAHSLSIGSLDFDPYEPTNLIAGIGVTTAGDWPPGNTSGPVGIAARPTGVLHSTDGGKNWNPLGLEDLGTQSVTGVAIRGETILAATFEPKAPQTLESPVGSQLYGLYRSTNQGKSFYRVTDGLPPGPVTSLVADPHQHEKFYAAVTTFNEKKQKWDATVHVSTNNGKSWAQIFNENGLKPSKEVQPVLKLAAGNNGSLAIAVIQSEGVKMAPLGALYLREEQDGQFSSLPVPLGGPQTPDGKEQAEISDANPSGVIHSALAIDPHDTSIVYWVGWEQPGAPTTTGAYRIRDGIYEALTCSPPNRITPPCSGSIGSPHADPRALAFDADGNLLLVGDGGVYMRTNPLSAGEWHGFNTLSVREPFQVGYGAYARRLVVDAQDTGVGVQNTPGSTLYQSLQGADGHAAVVADRKTVDKKGKTFNESWYYTSTQTLNSFNRLIFDEKGKTPTKNTRPERGGVPIKCNGGQSCSKETGIHADESAEVSIMLNAIHPNYIALTSGQDVYVAEDTFDRKATNVDLKLTPLGIPATSTNRFRALAYGAHGQDFALLAGGYNRLFYTNDARPGTTQKLEAQLNYEGSTPSSISFGSSYETFYVADGEYLHIGQVSKDTNDTTFSKANLSSSHIERPTSVEFLNNNGVEALLVGGLKRTLWKDGKIIVDGTSPIVVATSDDSGELGSFSPFGSGIPNVLVYDMSYNQIADVLAVGGVGRGVWTLFDVTSYFEQATTLQFGLADNDSQPSEHFLTNGTERDGTAFVRSLNKYGAGTLTIAGDASYTGGTTIFDGSLQLGTGGESGSILGDVSFCSDTIDPLNGLKTCNQGIDKFLVFDRSNTYSFDGAISGPGQLVQQGPGTTVLTGNSTYTGPTWVNQGALIVNGSIVSPVTVKNGGLLGGSGSVGAATVSNGGVLAPGNSIGTMTVNGDLALNSGSIYAVEANDQGKSDKVVVNGAVNLTGATLNILAAHGAYKPKTDYVIIDNDGNDAVKGTFANVMKNLAFLAPSVVYDGGTGNDVVLTLINTTFDFCSVTKTRNQCDVANAVSQFPIDNPLYLAVISQTEQGARQAFDALSGEIHATVAGTLANDSHYVREAMLGRMMQATYSDGGSELASLAAAGPQVASLDGGAMMLGGSSPLYDGKSLIEAEPVPLAFWTRAFGAWGDFDTDGNAASADRDFGGFVSGMDANIGGSWRVGLATGASFSNVEAEARFSSADIETYHLGGYVGGMAGAFALRGGGAWAWNDIDTSRAVLFPGFYERQTASYDADTGQLFGEVAYPTQMGDIALEPFAGLAYVSIDSDSFRERGGALASLRGNADQDVGYSTVGLRAATTMHWGEMLVTPHISAAWQHAFDDVTPGAALAFASTGIGFSIAGMPLAEDSVLLDTGLDFAISDRMTAGASYAGQFGDGVTDNAVKGQLTWLF